MLKKETLEARMAPRNALAHTGTIVAATVAASLSMLGPHPAAAQQPRQAKLSTLESLLAAGFEVKTAVGTQSGVVSTLVVQKDKDVFLCSSKDLSIQPLAFECWPIK